MPPSVLAWLPENLPCGPHTSRSAMKPLGYCSTSSAPPRLAAALRVFVTRRLGIRIAELVTPKTQMHDAHPHLGKAGHFHSFAVRRLLRKAEKFLAACNRAGSPSAPGLPGKSPQTTVHSFLTAPSNFPPFAHSLGGSGRPWIVPFRRDPWRAFRGFLASHQLLSKVPARLLSPGCGPSGKDPRPRY